MTNKELRKLSRAELIDILFELQTQNENLTAENRELAAQLESRQLQITEAGSIAEAALRLNGVFEAAQAAAELAAREVVVIPTKTVPQGISAMLSFDAAMEPSENEAAMTGCLSGVMTMQITYAARDSDFDGFEIHQGDYLALKEGKLFGTDTQLDALLEKLAEEGKNASFIALYYGEDVSEADAQAAGAKFQAICPDAEISVLSGGQPVYYYIISFE